MEISWLPFKAQNNFWRLIDLNNLRVISGKARGFRLKAVPGDSTRPITDRTKEALFNIIGTDIFEASLLDLFAGTGAVGIEALSRGASFVRFNDQNRLAIETIQANLKHTNLGDKSEILRLDAFNLLKQNPDRSFDYVYIAPPQYKNLWEKALTELDSNSGWLAPGSWVIVQIDPKEYIYLNCTNFAEFDQRKYGSTMLVFYEKNSID